MLKTIAIALIKLYRHSLSLIIGPCCRYLPSCSEYGELAIKRFGVWPGLWLTLTRVGQCHPWGGSGYDPVPDQLPANYRWYKPWVCVKRKSSVCHDTCDSNINMH